MLFQLEYIHDGVVQLSEHHKVDGKAGGTVLGGRIAREPGQSVVLLQNKPAGENTRVRASGTTEVKVGLKVLTCQCQQEEGLISFHKLPQALSQSSFPHVPPSF